MFSACFSWDLYTKDRRLSCFTDGKHESKIRLFILFWTNLSILYLKCHFAVWINYNFHNSNEFSLKRDHIPPIVPLPVWEPLHLMWCITSLCCWYNLLMTWDCFVNELLCRLDRQSHCSHRHIHKNKALVVNALTYTVASPEHSDDITQW